jgi:hypothetical protein
VILTFVFDLPSRPFRPKLGTGENSASKLPPKSCNLSSLFRLGSQQGQLHQQRFWSGRWESNPRPNLGKLAI